MKTIDFSYFIERFIAGEMDEKEKQWFLKEMEGNRDLKLEVDLRRKAEKIIERQDIVNLRRKLADIGQKHASVSEHHKSGRIKYAAAIVVFVIIGAGILLSRGRPGPDELFDKYYKTYEPSLSVRSGLNRVNQDFNLAIEYYNVRDYRNAAIYFSKVIQKEPEDMHSTLLNGISNFEISNYPEAEVSFVRVIDNDDNLFIDHAQWYLSMCYLKTDELRKAKDQLAKIADSESIYRRNAKQILRRLH